MEQKSHFTKPSLYDRSFILTKLIFGYLFPIFYTGYHKNGLDFDDLHQCSKEDESEKQLAKLTRNWNVQLETKNPKLWRALLRTFGQQYLFPMSICLFEECALRIIQPLLLGRVIRYFSNDPDVSFQDACWSSVGVTVCSAICTTIHHPFTCQSMRLGMRMRIACCALMYQKTLRLSRASVSQTAVGQIINIMSNDVNRMDDFAFYIPYLFVSPIQLLIVIYVVYHYLQWSCFVGIGLLFLLIPFQALMGKIFSKIRLKTALLTDARLSLMTEIISGIRVIKMYCWEVPFANRVAEARKAEVKQIRKSGHLKAINLSVFFIAIRIMLFFSFITYVLLGNHPTPEAVFVSMALFNTLRLTMTFFFPMAISLGSELYVTCQRIEKFLLLEELSPGAGAKVEDISGGQYSANDNTMRKLSDSMDSRASDADPADRPEHPTGTSKLIVNNIVAKWNGDLNRPTLNGINLKLEPGDLLAVIGTVGSGKSSFLMAILNELPLISGQIITQGTISYASQDPWTFNETVRNNILFGMPFDPSKYRQIINVCALEPDLDGMPYNDQTLVGEKGAGLSGGQKARINLARSVYRDRDIVLLDDPLSAVDTAVAKHIFEKCILKYLQRKIRILVTHQIQFIEKANKILILDDGDCIAFGTFQQLQQMGIDFMSFLPDKPLEPTKNAEVEEEEEEEEEEKNPNADRRTISSPSSSCSSFEKSLESETAVPEPETSRGSLRTLSSSSSSSVVSSLEAEAGPKTGKTAGVGQPPTVSTGQTSRDETFQRGSLKGKIYKEYLKAGAGPVSFGLMVMSTLLSQILFHGSDLFLTYWTNKNQSIKKNSQPQIVVGADEQNKDVLIYSGLIGGLLLTTMIRSFSFFMICMRASENLHNQIFQRLLRAKVYFFDSNPVGRILNRFTKDMGIVDELLPVTAYDLNLTLSQAFGIIIVVSIVNWYLIIPATILTVIVIRVRGIYIKSARDLKRLEGLARSPVYSHVSTTINGLSSIRAFGVQKAFEQQFFVYQNDHTATWFLFISSSRLLGLVIDWILAIYVAFISFAIMISKDMQGGSAGLAISSGLMLAGMTQWGVRQSAEFESQMTSVERIVEYQDLEKEPAQESDPDKKPSAGWPTKGKIVFDHMSLSYPNSPKPVLKDIDCIIHGGEKIGIVGRTGAGKSSMIAALFRLVEIDGAIWIDEINTKTIGLDDLRKKLSIIPQDPVVFTGTVRYNLDPFNEYPDDKIWNALQDVQLAAQVNSYPEKLEASISESGGNLSVGQRQLICLARAILKNNRILILDEATANVDHQTDHLIQKTIREKFQECTVLTIAHRLNTIIDCDRILVMDSGQIVEFDAPHVLLRNSRGGIFYEMCRKTGASTFSDLQQLAQTMFENSKTTDVIM